MVSRLSLFFGVGEDRESGESAHESSVSYVYSGMLHLVGSKKKMICLKFFFSCKLDFSSTGRRLQTHSLPHAVVRCYPF